MVGDVGPVGGDVGVSPVVGQAYALVHVNENRQLLRRVAQTPPPLRICLHVRATHVSSW